LRGRPWSWITGRPRLTDAIVVAFNFAIAGFALIPARFSAPVLSLSFALVVIGSGALWWRRSHPLAVLLVVICASLVAFAIAPQREPGGAAIAFAVYAVSVYDRGRVRLVVAAAAIAVILLAVALLLLGDFPIARDILPAGATSLVAWVIGDYVRSRRQFFRDLVSRHKQERDQAAEEERLRIARELHDVVAHNVSVMAIQAGAARVTGSSSSEALESIEKSARDTLSELNKLLGVLRKGPGSPDLSPQPSLTDVDAVLQPAREAGLEATLKVTGTPRTLPAAVDLSAYRIVQEAITNVLKHANASRVEVTVDYQPEALAIIVSDNGNGATDESTTGHGLIGMRERVEIFGGQLGASSGSLGGFTVRARLPLNT
jgi:signal transduction histidine kinase